MTKIKIILNNIITSAELTTLLSEAQGVRKLLERCQKTERFVFIWYCNEKIIRSQTKKLEIQ